MKTTRLALTPLLLCLMSFSAYAFDQNTNLWKVHTELSSQDMLVINKALPELRQRRSTWKEYRISLTETDNSFLVDFWREQDAGTRTFLEGTQPVEKRKVITSMRLRYGGLEVELDKKTLKVTSAVNIRE